MSRALASATTLALLTSGCGHSSSFVSEEQSTSVPYAATIPVRLTYNPADNYWPSWTQDGRAILYDYSTTEGDSHGDDRCIGLLRQSGGTRLWGMCDTRREHADSADSFAAAAIDSVGRLLYLEASTKRGSGGLSGVNQPPKTVNLWLADTTFLFQRRKLLDISNGLQLDGHFVNWLRDTQWLSPSSFVALAQFDSIRPHMHGAEVDSVFIGVGVVLGEIGTSGAALSMIAGTHGATEYSIAEQGQSLVVWRNGLSVERVAMSGGLPQTVATLPSAPGRAITGVTCRDDACIVTTVASGAGPHAWRLTLSTGTFTDLGAGPDEFPRLSPTSGDLVGRIFTGFVHSIPGASLRQQGALHLYPGLLH